MTTQLHCIKRRILWVVWVGRPKPLPTVWTNWLWSWINLVTRFGSVDLTPPHSLVKLGMYWTQPVTRFRLVDPNPPYSVGELGMAPNSSYHKIFVDQPKPLPTLWTNWGWPWTHHVTKFRWVKPNPSSTLLLHCVDGVSIGQTNPYDPQWHSSHMDSFGLSFLLVKLYVGEHVLGWPHDCKSTL